MVSLRTYQSQAIDVGLREALSSLPVSERRVVMVAPCGAGKTVIGADIARRKVSHRCRVLWLAHRTELIDQSASALEALGLTIGVVSGGSSRRPNPFASVQVASLQTLLARGLRPAADMVIFDECHHAAAKGAARLLASYPDAQVVGLTATPQRGDGKPLGDLFRAMVVVATIPELVSQGYLVECDVHRPSRVLQPGEIAQRPVDVYVRGSSALVFSANLRDAVNHTAEFLAAGINAVMIEGASNRAVRRRAIDDFRRGALKVIVNVGCLTEGTDLPICSDVILARGCGTEGLYIQITSRCLRPFKGKDRARLWDLRGVSWTHGHPCEDRRYSLDGDGIARGQGEPNPYPACLVCGAPKTPGETCSECGAGGEGPRALTVTGDRLEPYAWMRQLPDSKRVKSLAKWIRQGMEKGWKEGAAKWKFNAVFKQFPTGEQWAEAMKLIKEGSKSE